MRDIQDFVYRHFDYVDIYKGGTDLKVDCPFCVDRVGSSDYKQHLHISVNKQTCHCFRCDYAATWVRLVIDITGMDYVQALGELYVVPSITGFESLEKDLLRKDVAQVMRKVKLPDDFLPLSKRKMNILSQYARVYLSKRGFTRRHWQKYNIGVAESIGMRVIIPIEDDYWQARALFPFVQPKYINPDAESKYVLFNAGALHIYREVVVCEGAFSAMAVGDNAIALVGKTITREKLKRLTSSAVDHFIITVERGAEESMITMADALNALGKKVTLWHYREGDPADSTDFEVKNYNFGTKVAMMLDTKH